MQTVGDCQARVTQLHTIGTHSPKFNLILDVLIGYSKINIWELFDHKTGYFTFLGYIIRIYYYYFELFV